MAPSTTMQDQCSISLNQRKPSEQIMDAVLSISIEQSLQLPAMCQVTLLDDELELVDGTTFEIGTELVVEIGHGDVLKPIFNGEIVALELQQSDQGVFHLIVRAYDRSHRLHRGHRTRPFAKMTDGDLVNRIAHEAGLQPDIESTHHIYDFILQNNQTNYQFLRQRAERIGFVMWVSEGKLHFRRPTTAPPAPVILEWGTSLLYFRAMLNSSRQVDEVIVRGWDAKAKQSLIGRASKGSGAAEADQAEASKDIINKAFGAAQKIVVDRPVCSQDEADTLAQAVYDEICGNLIQAEGRIQGTHQVYPGSLIEIRNTGDRFGGRYYITRTRHTINNRSGYLTEFSASGNRATTLLELLVPSESVRHGVCVGLVSDNHDPENLGRVKVQLPWLGEQVESNWARVVAPMAGKGRGLLVLPEINDEVLVAFDHEDIHQAYILGALWNEQDQPPLSTEEALDGSGQVVRRLFRSRSGHTILLDDSREKARVEIFDKGGARIVLDDSGVEVSKDTQKIKIGKRSIILNDGALEVM